MLTDNLRIMKLRTYLIGVLNEIKQNFVQLNVYFLDDDVDTFSIDKIPTESTVERWITGEELHRDVYSFRSRKNYSADEITNIENTGFYELFEKVIFQKNKAKELPDIQGIESISCLNCGTMVNANTNTAEFDIQIQIEYRVGGIDSEVSS